MKKKNYFYKIIISAWETVEIKWKYSNSEDYLQLYIY